MSVQCVFWGATSVERGVREGEEGGGGVNEAGVALGTRTLLAWNSWEERPGG